MLQNYRKKLRKLLKYTRAIGDDFEMITSTLFNNLNKADWDFKGIKKEGVHRLGKYPATMVAPMQFELLSGVVKNNSNLKTLLDPFMGSGTTLVEGCNLNLEVTGIDINPYAVLLSEVKTHGYNTQVLSKAVNKIISKLNSYDYIYEIHDFHNIDKWFREDIKNSLSKIRVAILEEKDIWIRKFFWICFSEVIDAHSNDRTSTFKLHVKKGEDIKNIKDNCLKSFKQIILEKQLLLFNNSFKSVEIFSGDSKEILSSFECNSIDIICTSPPYGDNGTTVTYGQSSILFLKWIAAEDLSGDKSLIANYAAIDSASLGSKEETEEFLKIPSAVKYVSLLNESKRKKVKKFISSYYRVLVELSRILSKDGYILFTVGNRRVDGELQPLDLITEEVFTQLGLQKEKILTRNIHSKKMPYRVSRVKNKGSVESMNKEVVLIFRKV